MNSQTDDNEEEEIKKFSEELSKFLLPILNKEDTNPLMIAGLLMRTTIEIYTKLLNDDEIHSLLSAVASSIEDIRDLDDYDDYDYDENPTIH